jgi:hypothetical protein
VDEQASGGDLPDAEKHRWQVDTFEPPKVRAGGGLKVKTSTTLEGSESQLFVMARSAAMKQSDLHV